MKALRRFAKEPRAARLEQVPLPTLRPGQVLLRVHCCGLCGSDLHAYLNHDGYESVLAQVTFGHEWVGTVMETAPQVNDWKIGDRATMVAIQGCLADDCLLCLNGDTQLCPQRRVQGLHLDGGMAEYVVIDQRFLVPLPESLDLRSAALTEPLSVADHCVVNCSSIRPGDQVVVSGPGIIGMLCALVARDRGANVAVSGTRADVPIRLAIARRIGFATFIVGPEEPVLGDQVRKQFGREADVLIEASGAPAALISAANAVTFKGQITVVGIYGTDVGLNMTQLLRKQIDIRTSYGSALPSYERSLQMLAAGKIPFESLIQTYPLTDGIRAFEDAENQAVMKPMLLCD